MKQLNNHTQEELTRLIGEMKAVYRLIRRARGLTTEERELLRLIADMEAEIKNGDNADTGKLNDYSKEATGLLHRIEGKISRKR